MKQSAAEFVVLKDAPQRHEAESKLPRLLQSSADFVAGFVPPDYLLDGILQRRFCYSMTAPTGAGKTAISLRLSAHTALGRPIGEHGIEQGRVLYMAGENPDDVRMRWLAMAEAMSFDPATIPVHFLPGVFKLSEIAARIRQEIQEIGAVSLVTVDTSAAYFEGDGENDNVQMGAHGRRMRQLVTLPGAPCVLLNCHPVKNATNENLLPRGGGAFVAEMDGNLTSARDGTLVTLHWQGKFRGPDFVPIVFELRPATAAALRDSKGRAIPTVIAAPLSDKEQHDIQSGARRDEDAVLYTLAASDTGRMSAAAIAEALDWKMKNGKPYKVRVQRAAEKLKKGRFVKAERDGLALTEAGQKEARRVKYNADAAGATYG
jgi:hypothetical protein